MKIKASSLHTMGEHKPVDVVEMKNHMKVSKLHVEDEPQPAKVNASVRLTATRVMAAQRIRVMAGTSIGSVTKGKYTLKIEKDRKNSKDAKFYVNDVLVFHGAADLAEEWLEGATEAKLKKRFEDGKKLDKKVKEARVTAGAAEDSILKDFKSVGIETRPDGSGGWTCSKMNGAAAKKACDKLLKMGYKKQGNAMYPDDEGNFFLVKDGTEVCLDLDGAVYIN